MSQIYVWDKFIRFFHWSLVALFCISYLTGDELQLIHTFSGYSISVLILARLVWGFIGSRYARFDQFVRSPKEVGGYLRQIAVGHPKRYIGHNPAGAAMVIALLLALSLTTLSGMKLLAIEEGEGPFAQNLNVSLIQAAYADDEYEDDHDYQGQHSSHEMSEELWEEVHEFSVNLTLLLIVLHITGVFIASKQHQEPLVKAMFSGYKRKD